MCLTYFSTCKNCHYVCVVYNQISTGKQSLHKYYKHLYVPLEVPTSSLHLLMMFDSLLNSILSIYLLFCVFIWLIDRSVAAQEKTPNVMMMDHWVNARNMALYIQSTLQGFERASQGRILIVCALYVSKWHLVCASHGLQDGRDHIHSFIFIFVLF